MVQHDEFISDRHACRLKLANSTHDALGREVARGIVVLPHHENAWMMADPLLDQVVHRVVCVGRGLLVRIGAENDAPALHSLALVAASYGLPQRSLGAVSVIGPLRMDYRRAIRSVRDAAAQLSSFVTEVYDER